MGQANLFADSSSLTSSADTTESTMYDIQQQVGKTKKRVKALIRTMEVQNRLLLMMARKMNLNVEAEDLDARDWVSESAEREPAILGDTESADEQEGREIEVARL